VKRVMLLAVMAGAVWAQTSPTLTNHTSYGTNNPGPHTSTAISCTGANFLFATCGTYTGWTTGTPIIQDSSSNTWTKVFATDVGLGSGTQTTLMNAWYVKGATVSGSQTITVKDQYGACAFSCWSIGDGTLDTSSSHNNTSAHNEPDTPGSVTPASANSLIISIGTCSFSSALTFGVSSPSMTTLDNANGTGSEDAVIRVSYITNQSPAAAINPSWAASAGCYAGNWPEATATIVFKPGGAAAVAPIKPITIMEQR
jgi:hypothetical protein